MTLHTNLSFETATGSIDYPFTNDYMFRAILQKDKQVLKALIVALLHLKKESIHDVVITNPFTLFEDQPEFFATYELRNKKQGIFTVVNFPSMCQT